MFILSQPFRALPTGDAEMQMTKAQIKKLDAIIGRLEALQSEVRDPANALGHAKTRLMDVLREAEEQLRR